MPVGIIEVAEIDLRGLLEQPALGFELHAADEQVAAVAHVGADGALHAGRAHKPRMIGACRATSAPAGGFGNPVDQDRAQIDPIGGIAELIMPSTEYRISDSGRRTTRGRGLAGILPDPLCSTPNEISLRDGVAR